MSDSGTSLNRDLCTKEASLFRAVPSGTFRMSQVFFIRRVQLYIHIVHTRISINSIPTQFRGFQLTSGHRIRLSGGFESGLKSMQPDYRSKLKSSCERGYSLLNTGCQLTLVWTWWSPGPEYFLSVFRTLGGS